MKRSRYSPISASMICSSRAVPSVATTSACVSPRVNRTEPCVRGSTPVRIAIGRTVRVSRPSMRGSPDRICWRTVDASRSNMTLPTWRRSSGDASAGRTSASSFFEISFSRCERCCLLRIWYAARMSSPTAASTFAISASSFAGGANSQTGLPASSTSEWIRSITACCC